LLVQNDERIKKMPKVHYFASMEKTTRKDSLINDQLINGENYYYRHISVDNVIFGYHDKELKVLLLKPNGMEKWLLPGGYVLKNESLEKAAKRVVRYRTHLKKINLFQFKTFGNPERNKDSFWTADSLRHIDDKVDLTNHWLLDNFISVGYFALTEYSMVRPTGDFYAEECQWWDVKNLPELSFDHKEIFKEALVGLKIFTYHHPIGIELLPEKFTIPDIQALYETILDRKMDNRNFTKKITLLGLVEKLDEKKSIGGHRSPFLYKFNKSRYEELIKNGEIIVI